MTSAPFSSPQTALGNVNTSGNEFNPMLLSDGTGLYFSTDASGHEVIRYAPRPGGVGTPFGTSVTVMDSATDNPLPNPLYANSDPWLGLDDQILLFSSNRAGGVGGSDLYYRTRAGARASAR